MQVLQAGPHKYMLLELDSDFVASIVKDAGFEFRVEDTPRCLTLDILAAGRQAPLLLFDASDPGNLGWFSRCNFYVDGRSGAVMQTPISLSNVRDRTGHTLPNSVRLQISKELPVNFRMPGKQAVNEQVVYAVLYNFLNALLNTGVGAHWPGGPRSAAAPGTKESL